MKFHYIIFTLSFIGICRVECNPLDYEFRFATPDGIQQIDFESGYETEYKKGVADPGLLLFLSALSPIYRTAPPNVLFRALKIYSIPAYDAWAAFDPRASGFLISQNFKHFNKSAENFSEKRIQSIYYAVFRALFESFIELRPELTQFMLLLKQDPSETSTDTRTPAGLGNYIGYAVAKAFASDSFNPFGNLTAEFNRVPYEVNFLKPSNTGTQFKHKSSWQPRIISDGYGNSWDEAFPDFTNASTFSYSCPKEFPIPEPKASRFGDPGYKKQAEEVITASKNLNDYRKMQAEFVDSEIGLGFGIFLANKYNWGLEEYIKFQILQSFSLFDGHVLVDYYKFVFNAPRPFSVIRNSGLFDKITAWGGPGQGKVVMNAKDWNAYLTSGNNPEYPSGNACLCALFAEIARRFVRTETLGWEVTLPVGSSIIEPGITPAYPVTFTFPTMTSVADFCAEGRVLAGIHFKAAVDTSLKVCTEVASAVYDKANLYFEGKIF